MHVVILAPVNAIGLSRHFSEDAGLAEEASNGNYGQAPTALVSALLDAGIRVTVVTHQRGRGELRLKGSAVDFIRVRSRPSPRAQALDWWRREREEMAQIVRGASPDVVHAHWSYEWALAGLQSNLPLVITVRDAPLTIVRHQFDAYRILRCALAYWVRFRASNVTMMAASPYMARAWRRQMLWFHTMPVIPNIVLMNPGRTHERSPTPLLVEISDSGPRKNVKNLLRAFSLVRQSAPTVILKLAGHGLANNESIAEWARAESLDGGVEFLGSVDRDEVAMLLSSAWIHVHGALEESFGNTLIEAMESKTPVLGGSSSGAVPWVLDRGRAGALTDVKNPRVFADDMLALLSDSAERDRLSRAGTERAHTLFSPASVARAHLEEYESHLRRLSHRKGTR